MRTKTPSHLKLALLTPALIVTSLSSAFAGDPAPMGPTLQPASPGLDAEFHVGYSSDYIFRGNDAGGDLFEFGLDFAGSSGFLGGTDWSAGIWYASFDSTGRRVADTSRNELDIYGELSKDLGPVSVALGITNYSYFGNSVTTDDDIEPYISLGADLGPIALSATAYYDGSNNYTHDWYFEFSAAYERELANNLSGGIEAVVGWYDESNVNPSDDSDVFYGGTVSLSYAVSNNITVSPYASVTFSDNLGDYFFGGVSVGFSF